MSSLPTGATSATAGNPDGAPVQDSPVNNGRFRVGFATDIGRKRSQNQDNFAVAADLGLFMVADGMGGHQGGETASLMATQIVPQLVRKTEQENPSWDPRSTISQAIHSANQAIFDRSQNTPNLHGMGTTCTSLIFKGSELIIGHVGDSRCYLMRPVNGELILWQMTRDHSLVQEKLRAGLITREEIKTDRMKNVITRSVGFERDIAVETYHFCTQPGDVFLICSDGLSGLINDQTMLQLVRENLILPRAARGRAEDADIDQTVHQLIRSANENGGDDNITSVVIEVL